MTVLLAARAACALVVVCVMLAGCRMLAPARVTLDDTVPRVPDAWVADVPAGVVAGGWLDELADPHLRGLVDEALAANPDLHAAAARVRVAQAQARITDASRRPSADVSASISRQGSASSPTRRTTVSRLGVQIDVAWEADLWGRLEHAASAAGLDARASAEDYRAARLSLAARVAQAWYNALAARLQVDLGEQTVANFRDHLAVVEEGFRAGLSSALDVRLERANLAIARSRLEARRVDRDGAVRALEALLGRYPGGDLALANAMPVLPDAVPAGLPAELLARRPDVHAAMLRLNASTERVDAARKARLPGIRLTGSDGLGSGELRHLLSFDSLLWTLALSLTAPITDAGRTEAQVALERARTDEALARFAQVLLTAFREVETALASEVHLARQEAALREAALESEQAATIALERYRKGLVDIVTWLEARRRAFDAKSASIAISHRRVQNRIALHLALAGDFVLSPPAASGHL